jgi:hypothetical protein
MKYTIVKVDGYIDKETLEVNLENEVNKMIKAGWVPFGNVTVIPNCSKANASYIEIWQPMILN